MARRPTGASVATNIGNCQMTSKITICAAGLLLALAFTSRPSPAADMSVPASACHDGEKYRHIAMSRIARGTEHDPSGVWTDFELWNMNSPHKTDIWEGAYRGCRGERIVVSQIINRQCSSATVCPVRIVQFDRSGSGRVLLAYKQACTLHGTFALSSDGHELMACDVPYELD